MENKINLGPLLNVNHGLVFASGKESGTPVLALSHFSSTAEKNLEKGFYGLENPHLPKTTLTLENAKRLRARKAGMISGLSRK